LSGVSSVISPSFVSGRFWADDPHAHLAWWRQHDPVHWDAEGGVWGITRYDHVKEISKHPELFSNAGGIRPESGPIPMMIDMDDPAHWNRRKLVNRGFTPQRIREQETKVRDICDRLIDRVCEQGSCDFVTDIAAWLPLVMIGDALGFDPGDHATLLQWSDDMLRALGNPDAVAAQRAGDAMVGYIGCIQPIIEDRRGCPRDDLVSVLVHAEVDGDRLDDDNILHESLLILIGGDETTRHVISGGAYQVLAGGEWERLRTNPALLGTAVEEMLRWVSPIKNMARTATRDIDFHGQQIREGQKLLLLYPSANRDDAQFADPTRFDVTRSPNDHVAFGFGSHFCLGNALARLELRVMFERLLDRLPDLHLVDVSEPAARPANFVSGYEAMPVAFTPTAPLA
jgi:cytochrome P450 family 142 subfamily A polypeptide 1